MQGFAGICWNGPTVPDDAAAAIAAIVQASGPSSAHVVRQGPFLAAAGGSGEASSGHPANGLSGVADARLDERGALASALGLTNVTDGALLAAAYARWGPACTDHLLGDFAFALWDERQRRLLLARDRLGIRALYVHRTDERLAFASHLPALLALPGVPHHPNEQRIADFLMQTPSEATQTFYRHVERLLPARRLTYASGHARVQRYWAPDPKRELALGSDGAYADAFREHFLASVYERLRTPEHTRVGALLSGGLDSSSITCAARQLLDASEDAPLPTVSLVFDRVPKSDERAYIQAVADLPGIRNHSVAADRHTPFDALERQLDAHGQPAPSANFFLGYVLYPGARAAGLDVLLDGFAGDNLVGHGTEHLAELFGRLRWGRLAIELARLTRRNASGRQRLPYAASLVREHVLGPHLLGPAAAARLRLPGTWPRGWPRWAATPDLLRRTDWKRRALTRGALADHRGRSTRQTQIAELDSGQLALAFEALVALARAYGIDLRFPFAETRLVEFCLAVPSEQKYRKGWTRYYMRQGMAPLLPEPIRTRYGKTYLHHNFFRAFLELGRAPLEAFLHERLSIAAPYVDVEATRRAYERIRAGEAPQEEAWPLWNAVLLARWLEREAAQSSSASD